MKTISTHFPSVNMKKTVIAALGFSVLIVTCCLLNTKIVQRRRIFEAMKGVAVMVEPVLKAALGLENPVDAFERVLRNEGLENIHKIYQLLTSLPLQEHRETVRVVKHTEIVRLVNQCYSDFHQPQSQMTMSVAATLESIKRDIVANSDTNCVLRMKYSQITRIIKSIRSNIVNIVDFHFFNDAGKNHELFADKEISLVTPVGREILLMLDDERFNFITYTLNAGRRKLNFYVRKSPEGTNCKGVYNFVAGNTLEQIVQRKEMKLTSYDHEICYLNKSLLSLKEKAVMYKYNTKSVERICCRMKNKTTYEHSVEVSSFYQSTFWWLFTISIISLFLFCMAYLVCILQSYSDFEANHPKYCKLEERMMSPTSLLCQLLWKQQGSVLVSLIRRVLLIVTVLYSIFSCYNISTWASASIVLIVAVTSSLTISFCTFIIFYYEVISHETLNNFQSSMVMIMTLALNLKFIQRMLFHAKNKVIRNVPGAVTSTGNYLLRCFGEYTYYFFNYLLLSLLACLLMPIILFGSYFCVLLLEYLILVQIIRLGINCNENESFGVRVLFFMVDSSVTLILLTLQFPTYYMLTFALLSFLVGLFYNITYFLPYLASLAVFAFYCYGFWKSLEEKYFSLKFTVYKVCKDKESDSAASADEDRPLPEGKKLVPVVSKELYESIREKLLPYHTNLLWTGLKMFWMLLFSYGILELTRRLHSFNATAAVQVVATAIVAILPYVFNTIFWNKGGKAKEDSLEEYLEQNVKRMVNKFKADHPDLNMVLTVEMHEQDFNTGNFFSENSETSETVDDSSNDVAQYVTSF